ncbi:MAG: hypothetical protein WC157_00045 [Candidatus Paceibacterota bacterium]
MNKQKTLIFSLSAMLFIALAFIVYSWTEPVEMPSSYSIPLNTGIEPQGKAGRLLITELHDFQNQGYYLNLTGDSIVAGTISASNPTENEHLATKEYVDNNAGGSPAITKYFGSGIDGDVVITGNTTLNKDMEYRNLTINSGATLNPNGWRVFVSGTLTINSGGKISRDGNNGDNASGKNRSYSYGGTALATNRVGGSAKGGRCTFGCSASGGCIHRCNDGGNEADNGEFGYGGKGGYVGGEGGAGGTGNNTNIILREHIDPPSQSQLALLPSLTLATIGGAGGGGGAIDYAGSYGLNGGGGGGGGIIHIFVKNLVNNGTISARGGNGGNGTTWFEEKYGVTYADGGGGGGGGGYILLVYNTKSGTGTVDVSGGIGGQGGDSNKPASNGQNGGPGVISEYQVDF